MIDDLKPYPAMKDSGVPWLGEVPAHWEVRRGKTLLTPVDMRSTTGEEELLTVSAQRGVVPRETANVTMFKAESYIGYKLCWPGDLVVINSLWAWSHGLGVSSHHGIVSSAYGVYRSLPKFKSYTRFIHYLVRSIPFQWELQVRSKGIWLSRLQLTDEAFLGAPFPLPSPAEQTAIVRFLDHADRRIRRYIRTKQKLIALLEEQKQAVIHQAVTGQIDVRTGQPYPAYKPSGVEWLGDVPAHWCVMALKWHSRCHSGHAISTEQVSSEKTAENSIPVIGGNGIMGFCSSTNCGHAVLVIGRVGALCGNVHVIKPPAWVTDNALILTVGKADVSLEYLAAYLRARNLNDLADKTAQPLITGTRVQNERAPLPTSPEQTAIVAYLEKATTDLDASNAHACHQIGLLQEYRTRLIGDVVTGKLDVREAAAALPEVDLLAFEDDLDAAFDGAAGPAFDEPNTTLEEAEA